VEIDWEWWNCILLSAKLRETVLDKNFTNWWIFLKHGETKETGKENKGPGP
jgi:hypothetical protein